MYALSGRWHHGRHPSARPVPQWMRAYLAEQRLRQVGEAAIRAEMERRVTARGWLGEGPRGPYTLTEPAIVAAWARSNHTYRGFARTIGLPPGSVQAYLARYGLSVRQLRATAA